MSLFKLKSVYQIILNLYFLYFSRRNYGVDSGSSNTDEAQKKFGGAKAISSDMYFSGDSNVSKMKHLVSCK